MGRRSLSLRHPSSARHAMTSSSMSIGIVQCALGDAREQNVQRVETWIREAADRGAQIVLTPELFEGPYFPQTEDERAFDSAAPLDGHPTVARMKPWRPSSASSSLCRSSSGPDRATTTAS